MVILPARPADWTMPTSPPSTAVLTLPALTALLTSVTERSLLDTRRAPVTPPVRRSSVEQSHRTSAAGTWVSVPVPAAPPPPTGRPAGRQPTKARPAGSTGRDLCAYDDTAEPWPM